MMFYEIVLRLNHTGDNFQAIALCFFLHWLQSCPCVTGRKEAGHNHVGSISGKSGFTWRAKLFSVKNHCHEYAYVLSCWVVSYSLWSIGCSLPGFPGKNTGVGCHFLLQGIFLTQGSNPCFLHWQVSSLLLSYLRTICILITTECVFLTQLLWAPESCHEHLKFTNLK